MARKNKLQQLKADYDGITADYEAHFAGKARATREISRIDNLIERLDDVIAGFESMLTSGRNPAVSDLLQNAQTAQDLYRTEREAIVEAKEESPNAEAAADLATRANFVFDQYFRHYAGQRRSTRDIARMEEMVADLEVLRQEMDELYRQDALDALMRDLEVVDRNLAMYRGELDEIKRARKTGTLDEQASVLALAANEQFKLYNDHFAGKSRGTRRVAVLRRMVENLEGIQEEMRQLNRDGLVSDQNTSNIKIVQDNLQMYRSEITEVQQAVTAQTLRDRAGVLGGAANDVMNEYREHFAGKDRRTRNLDRLRKLCDELYDIGKQMEEIDAREEIDINLGNLKIVRENQQLYDLEYRRVHEAQNEGN